MQISSGRSVAPADRSETDVPMREGKVSSKFKLVYAAVVVAMIFCFVGETYAGGPEYVAGSSYFNASTLGLPLTWSQGQVNYYTDQGNLSPILPNSAANALVANAFLQWTSVSTATVVANPAGQLAEDVNGTNIAVGLNGKVTAPADITPSATQTPVGIVYDYDGTVTDALLGAVLAVLRSVFGMQCTAVSITSARMLISCTGWS